MARADTQYVGNISDPVAYHYTGTTYVDDLGSPKNTGSPTIIHVSDGDLIVRGKIAENVEIHVTNGNVIVQKPNPRHSVYGIGDMKADTESHHRATLPPIRALTIKGGILNALGVRNVPNNGKATTIDIDAHRLGQSDMDAQNLPSHMQFDFIGDHVSMHVRNANLDVDRLGKATKLSNATGNITTQYIGPEAMIFADNIYVIEKEIAKENAPIIGDHASLQARNDVMVHSSGEIGNFVGIKANNIALAGSCGKKNALNFCRVFECAGTIAEGSTLQQTGKYADAAIANFGIAGKNTYFKGHMNITARAAHYTANFDDVEGEKTFEIKPNNRFGGTELG
jgi:hypothetical protein